MYDLRMSMRGTQAAEDGQRERRPRAGRPERPLDPADGPLARFAHELRQLRAAAGYPSYRVLAKTALFSASVLSTAASGSSLPTLQVTLAYASACGADAAEWRGRWETAAAELVRLRAADSAAADGPAAEGAAADGPAAGQPAAASPTAGQPAAGQPVKHAGHQPHPGRFGCLTLRRHTTGARSLGLAHQ